MRCFIVKQWNGLNYEDSEERNIAVFATLKEASVFCNQNTPHSIDGLVLDRYQAYTIEEWKNNTEKTIHHWDAIA